MHIGRAWAHVWVRPVRRSFWWRVDEPMMALVERSVMNVQVEKFTTVLFTTTGHDEATGT